jgi:hypothetical protein
MAKGSSTFFKTKLAMALIGACLIGGTSAVLAARTVNEPSVLQTSNALTANSNSTGSGQPATSTSTSTSSRATATAQATAGGGGGGGDQPTATTPVGPQPTRVPTATTAIGQTVTYSGTVSSPPGTNTFVITRNGVTHTIDVYSGTSWTGGVTGTGTAPLASLPVGTHVQVTGTIQLDGSCLAQTVSSNIDN